MSFIAGQYTATYGGSALGQILNGFELRWTFLREFIRGDNFARARQDGVYQGAELDVLYELMEYNAAGAQGAFWPFDAAFLDLGTIGVLDSSKDASLVLSAVAGTPAAASPASITLPNTILAEVPVSVNLSPSLRTIAIQQLVYPSSSGVLGTTT